jgi:hypothetical protein
MANFKRFCYIMHLTIGHIYKLVFCPESGLEKDGFYLKVTYMLSRNPVYAV